MRLAHVLSMIAFSHSATLNTHTFVARLPSSNGSKALSLVFHYRRCGLHFSTPPTVFSCPPLLFCLTEPPLWMFMLFHMNLSISPPPPATPSSLCPAFVTSLVSITTATSLSCVTIFNQKRRKQREDERESAWKVRLPTWCIRWTKTNHKSTKKHRRGSKIRLQENTSVYPQVTDCMWICAHE